MLTRPSTVDTTPIPIFNADDRLAISFFNDGWGALIDAKIVFGLLEINYCDGPQTVNDKMFVKIHTQDIGPVSNGTRISVKEFSNEKHFGDYACAVGILTYSDDKKGMWRIPFRTSVLLGEPRAGAPAPPNANYDLFLEAGKSGYSLQLPISQVVPSKGTDHFQVSIFSDKSATFSFSARILAVNGSIVAKANVTLKYFLPRSVPTPTTPEGLYRNVDPKYVGVEKFAPYLTSIKYDPVHPQDFVIFATEEWMYLTTTKRNELHSMIEDSLKTLGLPKGSYCYRLAASRCIRSGSFVWK